MKQNILSLIPTMATLLAIGCSTGDERLARFAEQATQRQAEQNRQMAELQQQVAEGSRQLVEADAEARGEFAKLQRDLQSERSEIGAQRDALEDERREIASQRARDPIVAAALMNGGLLIACTLPLVLCWYLLRQSDAEPADALVAQVLLSDLVAEKPLLLAPSPQRRLTVNSGDVPEETEYSPDAS